MTVTFEREALRGMREDGLDELLEAHWKEVAHDQDAIKLKPWWEGYYQAEEQGRFWGFALRDGRALVGYTGFFVGTAYHYRDHVFAMNDVIYLRPESRGVNGIMLVIGAEQFLKKLGVSKVFYHVKVDRFLGSPDGDSLEAIESRIELEERFGVTLSDEVFAIGDRTLGGALQHLGYGHVENHFGKLLTGD